MNRKVSLFSTPSKRDLISRLMPGFSGHILDQIVQAASLTKVRRADILMREGEVVTTFGHVIDGTLGMVRALPHGKPHIMGLLLPGDAFGRIFDGPMPHSVEALTDAVVLNIDRDTYEAALSDMPAAEHALIASMIGDLDAARAWVLVLGSAHVVERVAAFLEILVQRQQTHGAIGQSKPVTLRLPLGRKDLARCLGIRPESLSRAIHRLEKQGIIEIVTANILRVPDPKALIAASGGAFDITAKSTVQARAGTG
ncbi:MAG: Crp/Fnr family transcriptional regulator [Paracoccaceae bacterium]